MTDILALMNTYEAAKTNLESYAFMQATDATVKAYNKSVDVVNALRRRLRKEMKRQFGAAAVKKVMDRTGYLQDEDEVPWEDLNSIYGDDVNCTPDEYEMMVQLEGEVGGRARKIQKVNNIDNAWQAYIGDQKQKSDDQWVNDIATLRKAKHMNSTWNSTTDDAYMVTQLNNVNKQMQQMILAAQNQTTSVTTTNNAVYITNPTISTPTVIAGTGLNVTTPRTYISNYSDSWSDEINDFVRKQRVGIGHKQIITMPDDTVISVNADGSYEIIDTDAKIKYKANPTREFNRYINASDIIEEYIRFCGKAGVKQDEMLQLPLEMFIHFLIIEAARADKEPDPELPLMPKLLAVTKPRCGGCGRFLARKLQAAGMMFDRAMCYQRKLDCVAV